jgi:hypothetical protein
MVSILTPHPQFSEPDPVTDDVHFAPPDTFTVPLPAMSALTLPDAVSLASPEPAIETLADVLAIFAASILPEPAIS